MLFYTIFLCIGAILARVSGFPFANEKTFPLSTYTAREGDLHKSSYNYAAIQQDEEIYDLKNIGKNPDYTPVVIISNNLATELDQYAETSTIVGKHKQELADLKKDKIFRAVGSFKGRLRCTGTFIAAKVVLTAAHCIQRGDVSKPPTKFYRERDCKSDGVEYNVERVVLLKGWVDSQDITEDIALLIIKEPSDFVIGIQVIPDNVMASTQKEIKEYASIAILGYSSKINADGCMLKNPGYIMGAPGKDNVYHDCDTDKGMSGGPIFDTTSGKIIGVHTYGFNQKSKVKLNLGTAMTKALAAAFAKFLK